MCVLAKYADLCLRKPFHGGALREPIDWKAAASPQNPPDAGFIPSGKHSLLPICRECMRAAYILRCTPVAGAIIHMPLLLDIRNRILRIYIQLTANGDIAD